MTFYNCKSLSQQADIDLQATSYMTNTSSKSHATQITPFNHPNRPYDSNIKNQNQLL